MEINCTLFVQFLNFGIAYVILSRLIFKPILESILEERAKRQAMQRAIIVSQEAIKDLETKRSAAWKYAQTHFGIALQKIPYQHRTFPCTYEYQYESATDTQVDAHAQRIHDAIMKKVINDFK